MYKKQIPIKNVTTKFSLPCDDKKDVFIQFRLKSFEKYIWNLFCKKYNYNQSQLFRKWMIEFMKQKGAIKEIHISDFKIGNMDVEDIPLEIPSHKELHITI